MVRTICIQSWVTCIIEGVKRNPPPRSSSYSFQRVARDHDLLCDMSQRQVRASHTLPLMILFEAQGDRVRRQGMKTHRLVLLFLDP